MNNYTIEELAEMLVDSILKEPFLNKETLVPVVKAQIKTMVDLKNIPKDYNKQVSPSKDAKRLRTIEQKDCEIQFWHNIVKGLAPEKMPEFYKQQLAMLVTKGFIEVDKKYM